MTRNVWYLLVSMGLILLLMYASCRQTPPRPDIPADYRSWQLATDARLNYPIPGHEDHFRRIFINPVGTGVQKTSQNGRGIYEFPVGTIIVKEIYAGQSDPTPHETPLRLTVMIKQPDHPQARGGWLWLVKDFKTQQITVIDYEFCVDCHANANERHPYNDGNPDAEFRDYVYFVPGVGPQATPTPAAATPSSIYPSGSYTY
jgi:hypothetical protein